MKFKISKAEWEALSDEQKAMYTAKGDNYQMAIDGLPDFDGMQAKLDTLLGETKAAKEARKQAEAEALAKAEEAAKKNGDVAALEKSWGERLAAAEQNNKVVADKYHSQISKLMVTNEAQALASKLFGKNAALLQHHITARLALEEGENGEFKTRILGADGKPSAGTIADLEKEFTSKDEFKSFLVTTKATGPTGALLNTGSQHIERKAGTESVDERRIRARELAAQSAEQSGNQY